MVIGSAGLANATPPPPTNQYKNGRLQHCEGAANFKNEEIRCCYQIGTQSQDYKLRFTEGSSGESV